MTTSVTVGTAIKGRSYGVLFSVCVAALVLPLSFAGATVATPAIGRELGGSPTELNWIVNAFMMSFGSTLMIAGTLADRYGRKRVFASGVGLFSLVSALLGSVHGILWLDGLRALQGIAAAGAFAGGSAILAQEFDGHTRIKAFSLLGTTFGIGLAFGPLLAGFLVDRVGWRAVFWSGTLLGVASLLSGAPRMIESRNNDAGRVDIFGMASFTACLVLFTFALVQSTSFGLFSYITLSCFTTSVGLFALFLRAERTAIHPMLDLSLFRLKRFWGVQMLPIATAYCYVVLLVVLPLCLIGIQKQSATSAGLTLLALSMPMLILPYGIAHLTHRIQPAILSSIGLFIASAGCLWLQVVLANASRSELLGPLLMIGAGTSMPWGLMDGLAVSVVPKERSGMAAGIFNTVRVAGESIAIAIVGAVMTVLCTDRLTAAHLSNTGAIGSHLGGGDLMAAAKDAGAMNVSQLSQIYFLSLRTVLMGICLFTLFCSAIVLLLKPQTDGFRQE